ncbi:MAG TPA: Smr/MutS family protein [Candidatus Omnitrophota bacterium]|nr:Smr/MutS family protein [Candidatus Omnitrophota bacterium]
MRDGLPHRPRRRAVTPDEARIWKSVVKDVAPLAGRAIDEPEAEAVAAAPPPELPPIRMPEPSPPPRPRAPLPELGHGAVIGLDKRTAERMKGGDMAIDGRIDLHGMTQDAAHGALLSFVARSYDSGRRCVLVITGKGREGSGVLRAQVPRWLNQSPLRERILSFSYARPQHGGEGALYVLIKRRRV